MKHPEVLAESFQRCVEISKATAKNFYYGFLLLPPARRRAMCALYAFMRHSDDLADEPGDPGDKSRALAQWRSDMLAALEESPEQAYDRNPTLPALAETVRRYAIPTQYLLEVLDGVEMDVEPRTFQTFDDLHAYCYRVASAVGLCCIHIWGFKSNGGRAEQLAIACGQALQLTNILRDVREDALQGRMYLPIEDLERFDVQPDQLRSTKLTPNLRALLSFEARRARVFYEEAASLERLVNPVGRPVLRAIVGIYRKLLDEIVRRDYDVLSERVALSSSRKMAIMARSLWGSPR